MHQNVQKSKLLTQISLQNHKCLQTNEKANREEQIKMIPKWSNFFFSFDFCMLRKVNQIVRFFFFFGDGKENVNLPDWLNIKVNKQKRIAFEQCS